MVRIINYSERIADDGRAFFTLEVQGGVEMIKSKSTGNYYATAKKASLPSTFDEETCRALLGTELEGAVEKQACKPYEYTVKDTGEVIELSHRYVFVSTPSIPAKDKMIIQADENAFSMNGILETSM